MAELLECDSLKFKHSVHVPPALVLIEVLEFFKPVCVLEGIISCTLPWLSCYLQIENLNDGENFVSILASNYGTF